MATNGGSAKVVAAQPAPLGPGFGAADIEKADLLEVWCSGIHDLGPDYTIFKLFDNTGSLIASKRIEGY